MSTYSPAQTVRTVAQREIQVALRTKGITVTMCILLVLLVAGPFLISWLNDRDKSAPEVAVVGLPVSAFKDSELGATAATNRDEAESLVLDGEVDSAIVPSDIGWDVLSDGAPSPTIMSAVGAIVGKHATTSALDTLGVAPEEFAAAMGPMELNTVDLSSGEGDTDTMASLITALAGIMIVVFTVMLFGANIGGRVTEEKASRVVEIILAAVRPLAFLTGKIVGNAIFGFLATTVLIGVGAGAMVASGLTDGVTIDWSIVPILLMAWLLGMLFFGSLYAAAGAMVQRTEDLQSTQMPALLLVMAAMYVPLFGWTATDATWMQVFSWIPPFSIFAAPVTYAAGDFSLGQLMASFGIATLAVVVVIWLVARIYRASILNNGSKMGWVQALRAG
ncbi:ABC transporter permease [Corynebacterium cystitidis]|uniref:ABC transporter permease n=1 Tax=Corynebacterium cystitidis TaxID=35757 RepID=UPI00211E581E|nr:ABC transporter permease [Corynebacterium cystitidis]